MTEVSHSHNPSHKHHPAHVHHVLAHSYSAYFLLFLVGVALDLVFDIEIFSGFFPMLIGWLFLGLGTLLILWAQHTTRHLHKHEITKETFACGPYSYTRSPTHWGLFLLILGFGLLINALFVVIFSVIAMLVTKFTFLRKQEEALERKYGTPYLEYKKSVKL